MRNFSNIEMNQRWMRSSRESAAAVPRRDSGKWEEQNSFPIKGFHHLLLTLLNLMTNEQAISQLQFVSRLSSIYFKTSEYLYLVHIQNQFWLFKFLRM